MSTPTCDLYELRETFNQQQIMVCFNGPINAALIEEIGRALRDYLNHQQETPCAVADIFAVYIEMTQNIRRYADLHPDLAGAASAAIVVSREDGHYVGSAGLGLIDMARKASRPLVATVRDMDETHSFLSLRVVL